MAFGIRYLPGTIGSQIRPPAERTAVHNLGDPANEGYWSGPEGAVRLANDYTAKPDATEPEPFFIRQPALSSFLVGLGSGEAGMRTLIAARQAYYSRRERERMEKFQEEQDLREYGERRAHNRDVMAEQLDAPELAGRPIVGQAIARRRRARATATIPEGYVRNPLNPGELLRAPTPQKPVAPRRPVTLSPGGRLVDPDTGKVIATAPDRGRPGAASTAQERYDLQVRRYVGGLRKERSKLRESLGSDRNPQTFFRWTKQERDAMRERVQEIEDEIDDVMGAADEEEDGADQPAPEAPKTAAPPKTSGPATTSQVPGYTREQIEELRSVMDEDDRDDFDEMSPEDKKIVMDSATGASR